MEKTQQIAVRVCMEDDKDVAILNSYLKDGYHVVMQSDVSRRSIDRNEWNTAGTVYYSVIIYILEK